MFPDFSGLAGSFAVVHRCYGSRAILQELQWVDAWIRHCKETGAYHLINLAYDIPIFHLEVT
jgi:hypothetical protein